MNKYRHWRVWYKFWLRVEYPDIVAGNIFPMYFVESD